jgi:HEXXH motif-containing protein
MTEYHRLDDGQLASLASGFGDSSALVELACGRQSRHMLLIRYLVDAWPVDLAGRDAAIAVLDRVQRQDAAVFDDLMRDPMVGAWLASVTRKIASSCGESVARSGDFLHLGAIAAAGALRAGVDCELTGYARRGSVTLPGAGEAVFRADIDGPVTMTVAGGSITVVAASDQVTVPDEGRRWRPLRRLTARHGETLLSVRVEDGNPYRDVYHAAASGRLTAEEAAHWQNLFAAAYDLIGSYSPERTTELILGLRAVVPLVDSGDGGARSGTARDSVGALGLTPPRAADDLAVTLVHEFQHSKLSAVLDLVRLHSDDDLERHFAPWRMDARPTSGLLQGVYAFLGVAHLWHRLRDAPAFRRRAETEFANARVMVEQGMTALEQSRELTPAGGRFVAGMRGALDALLAEQLPAHTQAAARSFLQERKTSWAMINRKTEIGH